jgi:acetyl-CoA synthetase
MQVRKSIGPFAAPKAVFVVEDLPKTRSGKIMRRILRKILSGEEDSLGDTSTVRTCFLSTHLQAQNSNPY